MLAKKLAVVNNHLRLHLDIRCNLVDNKHVPAKNVVKTYIENGYYHVYNRGVEKRNIFLDKQDCVVLLHYLKMYLAPIDEIKNLSELNIRVNRFIPLNLSQEIDLLSFSLMPNHFHFLLKQSTKDGITKFLRRLATSYVMYFNKKYKRVGSLFQGIYKAVLVESDSYLLHLSRYIHLNSMHVKSPVNFMEFSSYPYYLEEKQTSWIKPQEILSFFKSSKRKDLKDILSYQSFVEDYQMNSTEALGELILEDEC